MSYLYMFLPKNAKPPATECRIGLTRSGLAGIERRRLRQLPSRCNDEHAKEAAWELCIAVLVPKNGRLDAAAMLQHWKEAAKSPLQRFALALVMGETFALQVTLPNDDAVPRPSAADKAAAAETLQGRTFFVSSGKGRPVRQGNPRRGLKRSLNGIARRLLLDAIQTPRVHSAAAAAVAAVTATTLQGRFAVPT